MRRPRLLRLLAGPWKVAVLSAPAGYGKTTLASQYAERRRVLRCRIQPEDRDTAHILGNLLAAGMRLAPPLGSRTERLFASRRDMDRDGGLLTASFLDELTSSRGELLVVLDDLHQIGDAREALQWLRLVMEESGSRVRFLLTCRGACPLPLARFDLLGGSVVLTAADLRFTEAEQVQLLHAHFRLRLKPAEQEMLRAVLGGWPAGLILTAQRLRETGRTPDLDRIQEAEARPARLFSFLAEEVYAPLPPTLQKALCKAAYLDDLDRGTIGSVLGKKEAGYLLREVARRDLFGVSLPGDAPATQFHPLFRDFLRERSEERIPKAERRAFLARLARHWEREGKTERAIRTLLDAGAPERAIQLFNRTAARVAARRPHPSLPPLALEMLRDSARTPRASESPWILLHAGFQLREPGKFDEAGRHMRAAQDIWAARRSYLLLARAVRAEAQTVAVTGHFREAIESIRHRLERIPLRERAARGLLMLEIGGLMLRAGMPQRSREMVAGAERLLNHTPHKLELADASMLLADVDFTEGRWDAYLRQAQSALTIFRRAGYPQRVRSLLINMAEACIYLGREDHALSYVDEAQTAKTGPASALIQTMEATRRARAYSDLGLVPKAAHWVREARALSVRHGNPIMQTAELDVWEAIFERRRGDLKQSLTLLSRAIEAFTRMDSPSWLNLATMERALVQGLLGEFDQALKDLSRAARVSSRFGDRKESACNILYRARILQAAGRPYRATLRRALGSLVREQYLVLLRKEYAVSSPLLSAGGKDGMEPLIGRAIRSLPDSLQTDVRSHSPEAALPKVACDSGGSLRVRLLGNFEVFLGDRRVEFGRRAAAALVAYLALRPGAQVGREALAEALWPDAPADASRNRFDVTLNTARRALEPRTGPRGPFTLLVSESGWCRLAPGGLTTDVAEFENLARACEPILQALSRTHRLRGSAIPPPEARKALHALRSALDAYRGDLLLNLPYASWTQGERERLRDRHHRILLGYGSVALSLGLIHEAGVAASRTLEDDPLHEEAQRQLMRVSAARNDRAALVRGYKAFAHRMRRELATEPSPETTALFRELSGDLSGRRPD